MQYWAGMAEAKEVIRMRGAPVRERPSERDRDLDQVLGRLVDAMDDRTAELVDERIGRPEPPRRHRAEAGVVLGSLALGVAGTAVAGDRVPVILTVWIAVVLVNVLYAARR